MAKVTESMRKLAVLKAFETDDRKTAAAMFDMNEDDLLNEQRRYVLHQMEVLNPVPMPEAEVQPSWWDTFHSSIAYEIGFKVIITTVLMVIFWGMPYLLEKFLDPLTNSVVWAGCTALYYLAFGSLGVELLFWGMHNVNFQFFNRFEEKGKYDYESFLKGSKLTDYEKCVLNQQKYLAYLALYAVLVWGLLNQMHPVN